MLLCYSAIPSRSLRSAYQLMISGGDVKAVQGTTLVQAAPVEAEPTISVSALLELLKDADPAEMAARGWLRILSPSLRSNLSVTK